MIKKYCLIVLSLLFIDKIVSKFDQRNTQQNQLSNIDTSEWPIFKIFPTYSTDSLEYCKFYQNSYLFYFKVKSIEYFALSLRTCGFNVFNLNDPSNPQLEVNFPIKSGKINNFSFDTFRNILWIAHSEGKIFKIKADQKPFLVEQAFLTNNLNKSYFVDFIKDVNNVIMIICFNEIQIFACESNNQENYLDTLQFKFYKSISLNNSNDIIKLKFVYSFLLVGSQLQGIQFFKITQGQTKDISITYIANLIPNNNLMQDFQITSKNIIYIQQRFGGLFQFNASECFTKGDQQTCSKIKLIGNKSRPSLGGSIYIFKNEKYLITQYSTFGIQIFDISTTVMKNFQIIDYLGESISLILNENESIIIQSGSNKVQIYLRNKIKIELDKPNILLHLIQSTQHDFYRTEPILQVESDCEFDTKRNYLYLSRASYGLIVLKKYPQGILKTVIKLEENVKNQGYALFKFFNDQTIAYANKRLSGLAIIDFTTPEKPVYIKNNLKFGQEGSFYYIECTLKYNICAISAQIGGVYFLDIQDIKDPKLISSLPISNTDYQFTQQMTFMKSKKVIFLAVGFYGIFVVNLDDATKPQIISSLYLNDGSGVKLTSDEQYLFVASSYKGVVIIDIGNLENLKIISNVSLFGRFDKIFLVSNEKYLILPTAEIASVFLIDVQDKNNPILLQTNRNKAIGSYLDICLDQDESEGFITSNKYLTQTNFKNQVVFQQVIYQLVSIPGTNQKRIIDINPQSPLYVGQNVNMRIFPLNIDNYVAIKKVMIYENYILQPLKSWMVFQLEQSLLQLTILKDALQQDKQGKYLNTSLQIVFLSYIALDSTSFINSYLNITEESLSNKILLECQRRGYVDEFYMVSENFDFSSLLTISYEKIFDQNYLKNLTDENKDYISTAIKYVFKHSIVYYPIEITIAPSLSLDLKNSNMEYIKSKNDQVIVHIRVELGSGKFVNKNYAGVLTIIQQQQNEIKLEGDINKLNEVLMQKIKFSSIIQKQDIIFSIQVEDTINYGIKDQVSYQEAVFINEWSKIKLHEQKSIQNDFSLKFEDSSVYIKERFSYQIPSEIFDCEDFEQLQFTSKLKSSDGEYATIPQNFWLQFSEKERMFNGLPSEREFYQVIELQVNVTDGYSSITQILKINVNKIPLNYIVQILIQVIGPLLGVLGVWKYKYKIINFLQKKSYTYQKEVICSGKYYQKQILLNNWNIQLANILLNNFISSVSNKEIIQQIYLYQSSIINKDISTSKPFINRLNEQNSLFNTDNAQNTPDHYSFSNSQSHTLERNCMDEVVENLQPLQSPGFSPLIQLQNKLHILMDKDQNNTNKVKESQMEDSNGEQQLEKRLSKQSFLSSSQLNKDQESQRRRRTTNENLSSFNNRRRQTRFTKQLKRQFIKIQQIQLTQSKDNTSFQRQKTRQTQISSERSELWLLDSQGNINYTLIIQYILSNDQDKKIINQIFTQDVVIHLLKKNSLLRQTFECFLAEYILQKDEFTYNIFRELYNQTQQPSSNPQWYNKYCIVSPNIEEIHNNPVPQISFEDLKLENEIKQLLFNLNQYQMQSTLDQLPFSLNLLKETIKAYALGFTSDYVKLKPVSSGESLFIESYNIKQITSKSQKFNNLLSTIKRGNQFKCLNKIEQQFIEKPLVDNFKLPPWIKSVEIINNNLLIQGSPENKDIGSFKIYIYNKQNVIVRQFEIQVIEDQTQKQLKQETQESNLIPTEKNENILFRNLFQQNNLIFNHQNQNDKSKDSNQLNNNGNQEHQTNLICLDEQKKPHTNQFTL